MTRTTEQPHRADAPAYITPRGRDLRIDLIRGFCVLAMVVDHVAGRSPLYALTGGNRFLTSAAEGFILVSGLTAGLVYRRLLARDGLAASARKLLRRALSLYLLAVALVFLVAPVSELFRLPWAQRIDFSQPIRFVVSVLTLHSTYYLADAITLYAILFALMPAALLLLQRGYGRQLLAASWLLWLLHQFFPDAATVIWPIAGNYLFTFSAWQMLFFTTLAFGYHQCRLPALTPARQGQLHLLAGVGVAVLLGINYLLNLPADGLPAPLAGLAGNWEGMRFWAEQNLFAKVDLRPGRVLASGIVFAFFFLSLTRWWRVLGRVLAPLLLPFGQNALYAFTAHVLLSVASPLLLMRLDLPRDNPWLNGAIQIVAVALIWAGARWKVLAPSSRTRVVWNASPVVLSLAALILIPRLPFEPVDTPALAVSDAVLARARAYGTVLPSLDDVMLAQGTPAATQPAAPNETPAAPPMMPPTSAPATRPPTAALATRVASPMPAAAATTAPPPTAAVATPTPPAGSTEPNAIATATETPPPEATEPAPGITPSPDTMPADSRSLPPLPPDELLLQGGYIAGLAGQTYALSFESDLLGREMPYWVYLPPDYVHAGARYPVLYVLHGGGGDLEEWAAYGLLDSADLAFQEGILRPFIIVLPQGDKSFWTNWSNDEPRWGDYLAYEIVWQIDSSFASIPSRSARAVGGNSMGGWGALYQGFTHPDIFGAAAGNSPSLYSDDGSVKFLGTGEEYASKDPISLAMNASNDLGLRIWIDVGEEDPWLPRVMELQDTLQQRQVVHEWRLYPGTHGPEYWAQHVPDYLGFYADAFSRQ